MSYVDFITDEKDFPSLSASVKTDPSIIRMLGPEVSSKDGVYYTIDVYMDLVENPRRVLAFDGADYNLASQLPSNKEFELVELMSDEGRLWVNKVLVVDCVPAKAGPDGKERTKILFNKELNEISYVVLGSVDGVKAAMNRPVPFDFLFTAAPAESVPSETEKPKRPKPAKKNTAAPAKKR